MDCILKWALGDPAHCFTPGSHLPPPRFCLFPCLRRLLSPALPQRGPCCLRVPAPCSTASSLPELPLDSGAWGSAPQVLKGDVCVCGVCIHE